MKITYELDTAIPEDQDAIMILNRVLGEVMDIIRADSQPHVTSDRVEAADPVVPPPPAAPPAPTPAPSAQPALNSPHVQAEINRLAACSTAAVAPVPTAPVVSTDSSPAPTTAFAPPVPTPPSAAAPAAPPTVPPAASGERDSKGMPWDGRIHSSSKAFLADGTWRQRRNTDPAVVASVTAELRAAMAAPAAPAAPAPAAPQPWPFPPADAPLVPGTPLPPIPPAPVADVPTPPADAPMTFPMFMKAITAARIPPATVLAACTAVGVPNIPALMSRPDLIPQVATTLGVAP